MFAMIRVGLGDCLGDQEFVGRLTARFAATATPGTRRQLWRDEVRIDIAFPLQLYSDILHFGQPTPTQARSCGR
jgi:hypothetical protein